jgi:nucleotide-binding universal stress UspA family protein
MFKSILVPIDLADINLAKPAISRAVALAGTHGTLRLVNVLPMTPVMLAEYVPADFDAQQRDSAEEALAIITAETGLGPQRISSVVRQGGGIYHEILQEAAAIGADLIVMSSHRPAMRTYFLGSNAGHVVRYAQCSVLVVRQ